MLIIAKKLLDNFKESMSQLSPKKTTKKKWVWQMSEFLFKL